MDQITLADAARTVLLTIAPPIAGGALAKIGEDITDTAQETLTRAWDAVEARFKRKLSDREKAALVQATQTVEAKLAAQPKAAGALAYFRADTENTHAQEAVEAQLVEVFKPAPEELLAIARVITMMQPPSGPTAGARTVNNSGKIGSVNLGDVAGDFHAGSVDFSEHKRIGSPEITGRAGPTPVASAQRPSAQRAALPETLSADGAHFTFGHALIIGVGSYKHPYISTVPTTMEDARALGNLLRDPAFAAYPATQVHVLTEGKASRANILDALEALAHAAAGGTALIFFAGHGEPVGGTYALLPNDAQLNNLAETGITAEVFHRRVAKIRERAKRLVVLLNCCYAGGIGDEVLSAGSGALSGAAPPPEFYRPLAVGSGQVVISSSRPSQKSAARSQQNQKLSVFGAHLLDALSGKAPGSGPGVGVFELFAHLRAQVPLDAQHTLDGFKPTVQEPLFYASQLDDNFAVALRPERQGETLGADLSSLVQHLVELELQIESGHAVAEVITARDELLVRLGG